MKGRKTLVLVMMIASVWHTAAAQPKKRKIQVDAPPPESILTVTGMQSEPVLSDLNTLKPQMPLSPQDVLKSYEIAMGLVADKTAADFSVIVQAQQTNQMTREQAEYLLQQRYQIAMMQYQVLSALHEVLKHDIDEVNQEARRTFKASNSNTVVVVPLPGSLPEAR